MNRDEVEHAITVGTWADLDPWLTTLSEDDRATARKWYRGSLRATARTLAETSWEGRAFGIQVGLALALSASPAEASRNCTWPRAFWLGFGSIEPRLGTILLGRGPEWARDFTELAIAAGLPRQNVVRAQITALTSSVVFDQGLAITEVFAAGWVTMVGRSPAVALTSSVHWDPVRLTVSDAGTVRHAWDRVTSLYGALAATPRLDEILSVALTVPDLFMEWVGFTGPVWDVEATVRRLVADGAIDRDRLVDAVMGALTRTDKAKAQQVMVKLLRGSGFGAPDVASRTALIGHLLPTVHGSVTALMLDAVLSADVADDVLLDVGTVILVRREKAQKTRLLNHLLKAADGDARTQLLEMASADADATLASKAVAALGSSRRQEASAPAWDGAAGAGWTVPAGGRDPGRFVAWPADAAGLDAARSDIQVRIRITSDAAWIDLAVRFAHRDLAGLRRVVAKDEERDWWLASSAALALSSWSRTGKIDLSYTWTTTTHVRVGDEIVPKTQTVTHRPPAHVVFSDHLTAESLGRAGTIPELLSTPSLADGTVTVEDLRSRLLRARGHGAAPYDLVQALLRLEPTTPADAGRFEGIGVDVGTPGRGSRTGLRRRRETDAAEIVRGWIAGGGLPPRTLRSVDGLPVGDAVRLPLPPALADLEGLDALSGSIGDADGDGVMGSWGGNTAHYLGVVPRWTDSCAALVVRGTGETVSERVGPLALIADAPGTFGLGVHLLLALGLVHAREDLRLAAADHLVAAASQDRLSPALLAEATGASYLSGRIRMPRLAGTWDRLIAAGALGSVWPSIRLVLDLACSAERKPSGLADVLRLLTPVATLLAANAPHPVLPESVRALASQPGSSKAVAEARALVTALDGSSPEVASPAASTPAGSWPAGSS